MPVYRLPLVIVVFGLLYLLNSTHGQLSSIPNWKPEGRGRNKKLMIFFFSNSDLTNCYACAEGKLWKVI